MDNHRQIFLESSFRNYGKGVVFNDLARNNQSPLWLLQVKGKLQKFKTPSFFGFARTCANRAIQEDVSSLCSLQFLLPDAISNEGMGCSTPLIFCMKCTAIIFKNPFFFSSTKISFVTVQLLNQIKIAITLVTNYFFSAVATAIIGTS